MQTQKYFTQRNKNEGPEQKSPNFPWGKLLLGVTLALVMGLIILYTGLKCKNIYSRAQNSWQEMQFAYEKPNLVKAMRIQYETRQQKLEDEFTRREKSSQDKLIDEVVGKLEGQVTPSPTITTPVKKY